MPATIKLVRETFEVRVTRNNSPFSCNADMAGWHLYARYPNELEAQEAARRALTTGTEPYRYAKIIKSRVLEAAAPSGFVGERFAVTR